MKTAPTASRPDNAALTAYLDTQEPTEHRNLLRFIRSAVTKHDQLYLCPTHGLKLHKKAYPRPDEGLTRHCGEDCRAGIVALQFPLVYDGQLLWERHGLSDDIG